MRTFMFGFAVICLSSHRVTAAGRLDELFAVWEKAQADVRSLVVEYTVDTTDRITEKAVKGKGTLRLLRRADGAICGTLEGSTGQEDTAKPDRITYLLNGGSIYRLNHDKKQASRLNADGDVSPFVERWFNPLVILLDRRRAEEKYAFEIVKTDEWYTCLSLKPKKPKTNGLFPDILQGGVVLMNKEIPQLPKDMPRQLLIIDAIGNRMQFDIKSWRLNGPDVPKPEEFTKPENRPGWEVFKQQ